MLSKYKTVLENTTFLLVVRGDNRSKTRYNFVYIYNLTLYIYKYNVCSVIKISDFVSRTNFLSLMLRVFFGFLFFLGGGSYSHYKSNGKLNN